MIIFWTVTALIVGIVIGIAAEHKFDILKPKHVQRIEDELKKLRREIRDWIKGQM